MSIKQNKFSIDDHGIWSGEIDNQHAHDSSLASALVSYFYNQSASSILDLGAGLGLYNKKLLENGFMASCYDGNPDTAILSEGRCGMLDLSQAINIPKYDWVMSLEVGEHLPKEYEDIFLNNIVKTSTSGIILSWAVPGQGGDGHVNEQSNEYVKNKMLDLGYFNDIESENILREASSLSWFKNTIMVFKPITGDCPQDFEIA